MIGKLSGDDETVPRKGTPNPQLDEAEFRRRFLSQFHDSSFAVLSEELDRVAMAAWDAYRHHRKSPHTRKAGYGFADPDYELAIDWLAAREAILAAERRHEDPKGPPRFLLISGSSRSEHTCPGEMSKSYRLMQIARDVLAAPASVESSCSSFTGSAPNMVAAYTRARLVFPPRPRCAIGRVPVTRTTRWDRHRTG